MKYEDIQVGELYEIWMSGFDFKVGLVVKKELKETTTYNSIPPYGPYPISRKTYCVICLVDGQECSWLFDENHFGEFGCKLS